MSVNPTIPWSGGRWTAQLRSSLRGRRTQALLVATVAVDARYLDQLEASHAALVAFLQENGQALINDESGEDALYQAAQALLVQADALPKRED